MEEVVRLFEALRALQERRLKEERKPNPNKALIAMCKLLFNALTGKMVQKDIDEVWSYVSSPADVQRFLNKYGCNGVMRTTTNGKYVFVGKKKTNYHIQKPRHWVCRVYGMSHLDMFVNLDNITTMVYGDTDSAIMERWELD